MINITIDTVRRNLVEAGLLVVTVLMLFLGNVRAALIVAAVIPLSMLFGFMGMALFGVSANLMSLGAIDFGMMADGAVVMMEHSLRRLHGHDSRPDVLHDAAREMARPILFGVLIIVAVYLPVFFLEDLEGADVPADGDYGVRVLAGLLDSGADGGAGGGQLSFQRASDGEDVSLV